MSDFIQALPTIFKHEGRYANLVNDPGGSTQFGISLRFLLQAGDLDKDGMPDGDINKDGNINVEDVKALTQDRAADFYLTSFWNKNRYNIINDQRIATKIFDLAVNMGSYAAHKIAQRAVRAATGIKLLEDGVLGFNTFSAINKANSDLLYVALKSEAAGYYRSIKYNGSKDFINGWLNRAYADVIVTES